MKLLIALITLLSISAYAGEADQITFSKDIRPIFSKSCTSCHGKFKTLPNILDYDVAFSLRFSIEDRVVKQRTMPYVGKITESERDLIGAWVQTGARK